MRFSLEASGQPSVFRAAVEALMPAGTCVLLGSARSGTEVKFDMAFLQFGRVVHGVIQGESRPREFVPKLIDLLMQGRMPVDRMITFYDLADINRAAEDSANGATIKPVLRMSRYGTDLVAATKSYAQTMARRPKLYGNARLLALASSRSGEHAGKEQSTECKLCHAAL